MVDERGRDRWFDNSVAAGRGRVAAVSGCMTWMELSALPALAPPSDLRLLVHTAYFVDRTAKCVHCCGASNCRELGPR